MLTKLLGYEMRAFGRIILPLYAAAMGMALVIGLGVRFLPEEMYSNFVGVTVLMLFVTVIVATMVMTGVLCVQRFYQNLLGNEGYLMFSLPAATHQLILSKLLGSVIWTILGSLVAAFTVGIMGLAAAPLTETLHALKQLWLYIDMVGILESVGSAAIWILLGILLLVSMLMQIYASLAIGHQWTAHRILGSVLAYFGIDTIKNILFGLLSTLGIHSGLWGYVTTRTQDTASAIAFAQASTAISALLLIAIYSAVTWYLLDKRLNLE